MQYISSVVIYWDLTGCLVLMINKVRDHIDPVKSTCLRLAIIGYTRMYLSWDLTGSLVLMINQLGDHIDSGKSTCLRLATIVYTRMYFSWVEAMMDYEMG